jgi:hypothetical protein
MSESRWWNLFHKEVKSETIQPCLEFDNFKPRLKGFIFKCISWLNGSLFGSHNRGFQKEGVRSRDLYNGINVSSQLASSFYVFSSVVYSFFSSHSFSELIQPFQLSLFSFTEQGMPSDLDVAGEARVLLRSSPFKVEAKSEIGFPDTVQIVEVQSSDRYRRGE